MVGSVGNVTVTVDLHAAAPAVNGNGKALHLEGEAAAAAAAAAEALPMEVEPGKREVVLGRNVHTTCFAVKEPDADDEETGEREATMASVLALYRRSLVERTKHHLGCFDWVVIKRFIVHAYYFD